MEEDDEVVRGVEEWIQTQAVDDLEETQVLVDGNDDDDDDDDVFEKKVANLADGGVGETQVLVGDEVQEAGLANIGDEETQVLLCDGAQEAIFERTAGNLAGPDGGCGEGDKETQILDEDGVGEAVFEEKGGHLAAPDGSVDVGIGDGGDNTPYDLQLAGGSCKSNIVQVIPHWFGLQVLLLLTVTRLKQLTSNQNLCLVMVKNVEVKIMVGMVSLALSLMRWKHQIVDQI